MPVENKNLLAWIQLALSENVGPVTFRQLLGFFGSAGEALKHVAEIATCFLPTALTRNFPAVRQRCMSRLWRKEIISRTGWMWGRWRP